jgi:hypothetical protein
MGYRLRPSTRRIPGVRFSDSIMNRASILACVVAAVAGAAPAQDEAQKGTLKHKAFKSFSFVMPAEVWTPVGSEMPFGNGFAVAKERGKIRVDTNGDGKPDADIKGKGGFLRFKSKDGFEHAMRFAGANGKYKVATGCAMVGTVGGVPLTLFDLNGDGSYDEVGVDAMIVGKGKAASYLSKVISHKGKLFTFSVSDKGSEVELAPFDGEAGTLNLAGGFRSKGKLESVVVSDDQGNTFNLAGMQSGLLVPTGDYTIVGGLVKKGSQSARIKSGKMSAVSVRAGKTTKLAWGGAVMAEFNYTHVSGKVSVAPAAVHYYGKAGEEYCDWQPNAKSPKFQVLDKSNGKEEGSFIFAGC